MTAPPPHDYTEDTLIERPAVALFRELGWETLNLYGEWTGTKSSEGRVTDRDVVLKQTVGVILDHLPRVYTPALYDLKCDLAFRHVYDSYAGAGASVYEARG